VSLLTPGVFDLLGATSFPEMDRYLGPPNGRAIETVPGSNVWRRSFGGNGAPTVVEWDEHKQAGRIAWRSSGAGPRLGEGVPGE